MIFYKENGSLVEKKFLFTHDGTMFKPTALLRTDSNKVMTCYYPARAMYERAQQTTPSSWEMVYQFPWMCHKYAGRYAKASCLGATVEPETVGTISGARTLSGQSTQYGFLWPMELTSYDELRTPSPEDSPRVDFSTSSELGRVDISIYGDTETITASVPRVSVSCGNMKASPYAYKVCYSFTVTIRAQNINLENYQILLPYRRVVSSSSASYPSLDSIATWQRIVNPSVGGSYFARCRFVVGADTLNGVRKESVEESSSGELYHNIVANCYAVFDVPSTTGDQYVNLSFGAPAILFPKGDNFYRNVHPTTQNGGNITMQYAACTEVLRHAL
jgi:hypothetical protein